MRRWLALVLLCLLPLQVSWAAVAEYCAHEQGPAAQHFGHHDDEHAAWPDDTSDAAHSGSASPAHDHPSHLAGFAGLLGDSGFSLKVPPHASPRAEDRPPPASLPPDQPERPKWAVPA